MKIKNLLEILILLGIISIIIYKVDLKESFQILQRINLYYYLIALLLFLTLIFINSQALKVLFDTIKQQKFNDWLRIFIPSFVIGMIIPVRAGDVTMAVLGKNKGFEIGQSTSIMIIDKLITLLIFTPIAAIGLLIFINTTEIFYGIIFSILLILGFSFLYSKSGRLILIKILGKKAEIFKGFKKTLQDILNQNKRALVMNGLLTLIRPLINGLVLILLLASLGYNLNLMTAIIISSITFIVLIIPITPNGLGIKEGLGTILLSVIGIPAEASIAMYILLFSISCLSTLLYGLYYLIIRNNSS
jgi:uncharacterized protein (TIRG00374 family)